MNAPQNHSTSEYGHAKNVANFQTLISILESFGTDYNPFNPNLSIPQLQILYNHAKQALDLVHPPKSQLTLIINQRQEKFAELKPLSTQILNAIHASGSNQKIIDDIKSINRKIQGKPAKSISNAQLSYDLLVQHFAELIALLTKISQYQPNEPNLQISNLNSRLQLLYELNLLHINALVQYKSALHNRNQLLYTSQSGLVPIAKQIKKYIKSIYGYSSPQHSLVTKLVFR